eukprot:CAMPEP_0171106128 /NCGR_PEP_ID=MMETSP0766_2-20121228/64097_1 /TAXON_ID=439317 /ORGANISM="Gambierdiscus australes, Strain CAWD 149" /LENGTH=187 /DNA_ID=CAMNT_0011567137 /DNA_START=136 /DNA_END=699 /DNA_ORIENTATION=+
MGRVVPLFGPGAAHTRDLVGRATPLLAPGAAHTPGGDHATDHLLSNVRTLCAAARQAVASAPPHAIQTQLFKTLRTLLLLLDVLALEDEVLQLLLLPLAAPGRLPRGIVLCRPELWLGRVLPADYARRVGLIHGDNDRPDPHRNRNRDGDCASSGGLGCFAVGGDASETLDQVDVVREDGPAPGESQ